MLNRRLPQQGFSLIELMVGVVITGVLLSQALPAIALWMNNLQIRGGAESILNGLQLAKSQAVKSNQSTEFILTASTPAYNSTGSTTGKNWVVRTYQSTGAYTASDFVQGHSNTDGSASALDVAGQASIVFTPLGRLFNPPAADINIDVSSSYSGSRPMRIIISRGGQILMCDPDATAKAANPNNPQFC